MVSVLLATADAESPPTINHDTTAGAPVATWPWPALWPSQRGTTDPPRPRSCHVARIALYAGQQGACVRTHVYCAESLVHAGGGGTNGGARSSGRGPCYCCTHVLSTRPPPGKALCDYGYELNPQSRAPAGCVAVAEFGGLVLDCRRELRSGGIPNLGKLYWRCDGKVKGHASAARPQSEI